MLSVYGIGQTINNQETHQINIHRTSSEIKVDGVLDEGIWDDLDHIGDFWYSFPVDDRAVESELRTEVRITYDDKYIYIAAKCYGSGPFLMPTLKRDSDLFWDGDVFSVVFDPINEKTNGFGFGTNPSGVQYDVLIGANTGTRSGGGGGGFNDAWDNKWLCNSSEYIDHWTTEIAIPFTSLKYGDKKNWGINFLRGAPENNSWHTWAPVPVQFVGVDLGFLGQMNWSEIPPKSKSNISVIPYALTSAFNDIEADATIDTRFRIGADAKIALNSNLNIDLTFNPDFSQVDVDQQVTNLTTVNIRFPERRLFFLENADIFSEFGIPPMRPFFSRRIGLDEDANAIPILYGARLSGNLNSNLRIGASNLQTGERDGFLSQNYTSLAFNQQIFGRTSVKGYFHNRQAYVDQSFSTTDYNRALGAEIEYRTIDGSFRLNGGGGMTLTNGLDSKNYTYHGIVSYNNRNLSFYTNLMAVGDNYVPDMGFMTKIFHYDAEEGVTHRIGYGHSYSSISYTLYPKTGPVVSHRFSVQSNIDYTERAAEFFDVSITPAYAMNFQNTSSISVEFENGNNQLFYPFAFTDADPLPIGLYNSRYVGLEYQSDQRKQLSYELGFERGTFFGGRRIQYAAELNYRQQPWGNFGLRFIRNDLVFADQYGSTSLTLLGPTLEFNFSRNLFWTSFLQYNTQSDNFNINSRLQWQFRPLSNIFLVYSENYAIEQWGPKNRAVVLKANYWLNI
jgi:hypothetical protein